MATNTDIIDSPALDQLIAQYFASSGELSGLPLSNYERRRRIEDFKSLLLSQMERDPEIELNPANALASAAPLMQQLERNRLDTENAALRTQQRRDADRVGIDPFRGERVFAGPTGGIGTQKVQPRTEGGPYPVGGIGTRKIRDPIPRRPRRGTIEEIVGERPYTLPEGARRRQGTIEEIVGGRPYTLPEGARRRQGTIEEIVGERPYTLPEGARRRQGTIEEIVGERPYTLPEGESVFTRRGSRPGTIEEIVGERPYTLPAPASPASPASPPVVPSAPSVSDGIPMVTDADRDFLRGILPATEADRAFLRGAGADMAMATTPRQRAGETLDVRPRNPFDRGRGSNADILAANYARMAMEAENEDALRRLVDSRRLATSYARGGLVIDPRGIGSLREDRG